MNKLIKLTQVFDSASVYINTSHILFFKKNDEGDGTVIGITDNKRNAYFIVKESLDEIYHLSDTN